MLRALWNGATGMSAQTLKMDSISNNVSNVNTTGYKKNQANFQDLVYQALNQVGNPVNLRPEGGHPLQSGVGVRISPNDKLFTQGDLMQTERNLDIALEGNGFLGIRLPDGRLAFSRDGLLKLDSNGKIVSAHGLLEMEGNGVVPPGINEVEINSKGQLSYLSEDGEIVSIGQLRIYKFNNPSGLDAHGNNLFFDTLASGPAVQGRPGEEGFAQVKQGFLEMSNVNVADELVRMIETQRAYEMNSRSIKTADDMWSMANNIKR